jgi:hypothetical protein
MRSRIWISLGVAGLILAAPPATAAAQFSGLRGLPTTGRMTVDGYVSRYRLTLPNARTRLDGMGGRIMWALAPTLGTERERLAEHLALGVFVAATPGDVVADRGTVTTTLYGLQLDARPLGAPIGRVLEPVLSLGVGALQVRQATPGRWILRDGKTLVPHDVPIAHFPQAVQARRTHVVLAPAIGVLVSPQADFALRFDARKLLNHGGTELSTGISLRL